MPKSEPPVTTDLMLAGDAVPCVLQRGSVLCLDAPDAAPRLVPALTGLVPGSLTVPPEGAVACGIRAADSRPVCAEVITNGPPTWDYGPRVDMPVISVAVAPGFYINDDVTGPDYHGCAVRAGDGAVFCWGKNDEGQLGEGRRDRGGRLEAWRIEEPQP